MLEPDRDMAGLPRTFPLAVWVGSIGALLATYGFVFIVVHPVADTRVCVAHLPDPLFALIPLDRAWHLVTHEVFIVGQLLGLTAVLAQAFFQRDHRLAIRWINGVWITGLQRAVCILLIPVCKITRPVGVAPLVQPPMIDLGFVEIPFHLFANNDLVFSGHVSEFFLLYRVTRSWPTWARVALLVFQVVQIYGLLATRGHYTIDILLAFPCAYLADRIALRLLARREVTSAA